MTRVLLLLTAALIAASSGATPAAAQGDVILVRGGTVHTATGAPIANGSVLIRAGKIVAVGANVAAPSDARIVDATGKVVIPGMIDNHSHIGARSTDLNDSPMLIGPQHRFLDALDWSDPDFGDAVEGGVTTVVTGPGSGENVSGMAVVIKTFGTDYPKRMLLEKGGMKFAMGPKGRTRYPATAMGVAANLRQYLIKTQEYMAAQKKWEDDGKKGNPPARDLGYEAMSDVLMKRTYVRAHVHSATDVMTLTRLKDEFGFDLTIHHSTEAYKVAPELAKRGITAVVLPLGPRIGLSEDAMAGPYLLWKVGVKIAMHTDAPVISEKWLRLCAALAMRYGIPEDEALKMVTINAAEIARVSDRVGSIAVGKDADVVIFNGPWYEPRSRIDVVIGDGAVIYDRSKEAK
ncbi:MAG TPA: amidohydrolase family protein [Gemmatimonadaceae bacterium]|nr:amidohydrolase family protein [Gemmatimonadaceae bacterium]